ncbi:uncharacterized protein LOC110743103 [Papio anubis]|uniref:uncharacterized protein LOC110743103 n=1 Tax=Papio anubis TaxID=9555 RepID=UPI000B7B7E45|nr:uncharacterized protein LOC110743103 [Papio anubis]
MLSLRRPRARRRKRRRPLHWVGRARRGLLRGREEGALAGERAAATSGRSGRARAGGEGLPQRQRGPGMAARAGGSAVLGNRGAAGPRPLHSPPPSSPSSDGLLFHLPAARAAGTSPVRRRQRRKRWQQRLRHPIWRTRVGPRSSGIRDAGQRAPWRLDRASPGGRAETIERAGARASPPGGPARLRCVRLAPLGRQRLAPSPRPADAGASAAASRATPRRVCTAGGGSSKARL